MPSTSNRKSSNRKSLHYSSVLINKLLFHTLQLGSYAGIQAIIIDIENKTTFNRRVYHSFQLHLRMKNRTGRITYPFFRFLIDRYRRDKFAYTDVFQLPVQIQKRQANKLQVIKREKVRLTP